MEEKQWVFRTFVNNIDSNSFNIDLFETLIEEEMNGLPYKTIDSADELIHFFETTFLPDHYQEKV